MCDDLRCIYWEGSRTSQSVERVSSFPEVKNSNEKAKKNIANIWKWSTFSEEKEALLAVGTKLKILSVHYFGYKWEIEVELMEDDEEA
ncbi:unnamed protein product [Rotaria sp. Silwood2]|nr:unnamed protein product [Rotaria sp. Silwood2]